MRSRLALALAAVFFAALPAHASGPVVRTVVGPRALCCTDGIAYMFGSLYVNQAALDQIVRIDLKTNKITTIANESDAALDQIVTPDDVWADPQTGDLYVTEILAGGIRKITSDGSRSRVLAGFQDEFAFPNSITGLRKTGQTGLRLFFSLIQFEPGRHAGIWEYDPQAFPPTPPTLVYGAVGKDDVYGEGLDAEAFQFDPDGKELYVPSTYGGKVLAINVDSHRARTVWDGDGGNGIAVRFSKDGSLLYADQASGRILRLDPYGDARQTPTLVAQLAPGIDGIAEVPDGRIFTTNFQRGGLDVVETDGTTHPFVARSLDLPMGIAPLADGRIAVADLGSVAYVGDNQIARPQMFIRDDLDIALGVAVRGACDVYATGFFRMVLQHVNACDPKQKRTEVVPRNSFVVPGDVAIMGDQAWIADEAGVVWRVSGLNGAQPASGVALVPGVFAGPSGIAVAPGALYVSENLTGDVRVVDPTTGAVQKVLTGFDGPEGLALDHGSLLVMEENGRRLTRVDLATGAHSTVVDGLATKIRGISAVPVLNYYADVAVASDGTIYVSLPATGELLAITV